MEWVPGKWKSKVVSHKLRPTIDLIDFKTDRIIFFLSFLFKLF
jgi:hypothetical protein